MATQTPRTPPKRRQAQELPRSAPETPRHRKEGPSMRLRGIKTRLPEELSVPSIKTRLQATLGLSYTPDDWQAYLVHRLFQGYDSILCAGTGYGKSLIFEGLAVLGGFGKLVVVISPLKALERDQVCIKGVFFDCTLTNSKPGYAGCCKGN